MKRVLLVLFCAALARGQSRLSIGLAQQLNLSGAETASFVMDGAAGQYIRLAAIAPESAAGLIVFDATGERVAQGTSRAARAAVRKQLS
jgi:hypothetical protein